MKRYILSFFLIASLSMFSCQKKNIYKEFHEFKNYSWGRFDKVTFNIPIDKKSIKSEADIVLSIRHLDQYPYDNLPLNIILRTPSGEERVLEKDIELKDSNHEFKGSVAGSYWDYDEILWKGFYFNMEGTYTIELENLNPRVNIPGLVDLGLTVKRTK
ncbi:MAG: hypothetical protein ACM3PX_06185 [Omnitrophica WOR_2 bacterium]